MVSLSCLTFKTRPDTGVLTFQVSGGTLELSPYCASCAFVVHAGLACRDYGCGCGAEPIHERIFKAMDTDKDGTLTLEEMQTFMRGTGKTDSQHEH